MTRTAEEWAFVLCGQDHGPVELAVVREIIAESRNAALAEAAELCHGVALERTDNCDGGAECEDQIRALMRGEGTTK